MKRKQHPWCCETLIGLVDMSNLRGFDRGKLLTRVTIYTGFTIVEHENYGKKNDDVRSFVVYDNNSVFHLL